MKYFNKIEEIKPELYEECAQKGKVERIDYHTTNYDGQPMDKHGYVYTPFGYDETKEYEILYLIHGSLEDAEKYLYLDGEENKLKRAVDNMIANGTIKPIIIVTPSPYPFNTIVPRSENVIPFLTNFHNELCDDLMPVVEAKYHTYANYDVSKENLIKVRDHRKILGWSMGSRTTWYVMEKRIAYFSTFGLMSGAIGFTSGELTKEEADSTAKEIIDCFKQQGFTKKDVDFWMVSGTLDSIFPRFSLLLSALYAYPDYFDFHSEEKNATYLVWPEGEHHTKWRLQYTINAINQFYHN